MTIWRGGDHLKEGVRLLLQAHAENNNGPKKMSLLALQW